VRPSGLPVQSKRTAGRAAILRTFSKSNLRMARRRHREGRLCCGLGHSAVRQPGRLSPPGATRAVRPAVFLHVALNIAELIVTARRGSSILQKSAASPARSAAVLAFAPDRLICRSGSVLGIGPGRVAWGARHLGIYDTTYTVREKGEVKVLRDFTGWGFGLRHYGPEGQAYCWAKKPASPVVIEIAVKSGELTEEEKEWILQ